MTFLGTASSVALGVCETGGSEIRAAQDRAKPGLADRFRKPFAIKLGPGYVGALERQIDARLVDARLAGEHLLDARGARRAGHAGDVECEMVGFCSHRLALVL